MTVGAIPCVKMYFHISVSRWGCLSTELWGDMLVLRTGGQYAWLAAPPFLHQYFLLLELEGAQASRWAWGAPSYTSVRCKGTASFLQHGKGFLRCPLIASCLWGSSISLESICGRERKELVSSCYHCPHLPHLIQSLRRKVIVSVPYFLWSSLSAALVVHSPFHQASVKRYYS